MKLRDVVIFIVGAATGGLVATKIVSSKYEKIIKKEVDETREAYNKLRKDLKDKYEKKDEPETTEAEESCEEGQFDYVEIREEVDRIVHENGYIGADQEPHDFEEPLQTYIEGGNDRPYPIAPKDVCELGYIRRRLIKYADGVITEAGELGEDVILDVDDIVGFDNIEEHIGDYEAHMLYIRNDKYKSDYVLYECDDVYEPAYE